MTTTAKLKKVIRYIVREVDDHSFLSQEDLQHESEKEATLRRFCELVGIDFNDKRALANYFSDQAAASGVDRWGNTLPDISSYEEQ